MGFIEGILNLALFGSVTWALLVLAAVIFMFFVADVNENGFLATGVLVISSVLFYVWGRESFDTITSLFKWYHVLAYFGIGLIHAFIRVFFYGRNEMLKVNETRNKKEYSRHKIQYDIKGHVFRWWFLWPFSLLVWFAKDIIRDVYDYCYDRLEKLFNSVMDLGITSVTPLEPDPIEDNIKNKVGFNEYKEKK